MSDPGKKYTPGNPFAPPSSRAAYSPDNPFAQTPAPSVPVSPDTLRQFTQRPEATAQRSAPAQPALTVLAPLAQSIIDLPQVAIGTVRHIGRSMAGQQAGVGYTPTTPEQIQDATRAQTGIALAASAVVGGLAGTAIEAVVPVAAEGATGLRLLVKGLRAAVMGTVRGSSAGATFGSLRPTRGDETRLHAILGDALGFAAIDATLGAAGVALSGVAPAAKPLAPAQVDQILPRSAGPIVTSPSMLHDDLVAAGLHPERAWSVLRGETPIDEAWRQQWAGRYQRAFDSGDTQAARAVEQEIESGIAASKAAATGRGFAWLVDGRPVEQWPNRGEMFTARQRPDGSYQVHVADQTNTVAGHGVGTSVESALAEVRGLPPSAVVPSGAVSDAGAAVSATPINAPPAPEFTGFFGGLRYFTQSAFGDRFAAVRRASENVAAALNNHAASRVSAGYMGILIRRMSGLEGMDQADRELLGSWFNAREGARLRTRLGAQIREAEDRIADAGTNDALATPWRDRLSDAQGRLAAVRVPELTHEQMTLFATRRVAFEPVIQFFDQRVQPLLEEWKYMTGLSQRSLSAAIGEEPVFSLVPRMAEDLPAAETVESAVRGTAPAGLPGSRAPLQAQFRAGATRAALERTGTGTYETDIHTLLDSWLGDTMPRVSKLALMEEIVRSPGARRLAEGESARPGLGVLELGTSGKIPGERIGGRWEVPLPVKRGFEDLATRRNLLAGDSKMLKSFDFFTQLQLAAPVEAASHSWRIVSQLAGVPGVGRGWARALTIFPSLGPKIGALADVWRTGSDPVAMTQAVQHLARIGALTGRPLSEESRNSLFAWLDQSTLLQTPRRFLFGMPQLGPGLDGLETRVRVAGYHLIRNLVRENLSRDATDNEIRQFVNGWGVYGTEMQPLLLAAMRKTRLAAFGSFQTSAIPREMTRLLGWALPGTSGGTGLPQSIFRELPLSKQMAMRAEVAWRGLIGDMMFRSMITKASTGYWPWDPAHRDTGHMTDVAIGTIGTGEDERFVYLKGNMVDPGVTRALRTTGTRAAMAGASSGNLGQFAQQLAIDYTNTLGGVLSPWTRFASVAATGKALYFTGSGDLLQEAPLAPTAGGQMANNLVTAVGASNPIISQVVEERNAVRSLPSPLAQLGAMTLNAVSPGMTVGPRRAIWSQTAVQREQTRLLNYVSQQASWILEAPSDQEFDTRLDEAQETIRGSGASDVLQAQAQQVLMRSLRSRPRARAKRAAIQEP